MNKNINTESQQELLRRPTLRLLLSFGVAFAIAIAFAPVLKSRAVARAWETIVWGPMSASSKSLRVVQHPGANENLLNELSRKEWINLKKSAKSKSTKLYATLGAKAFDVAIVEARRYLAQAPRNQDALTVLATALAMTGQYQHADYYADLLDKYYPNTPLPLNIKGLALMRRPNNTIGDYQNAAELFEAATQVSQTEVAAALNLGHLHLELGNASASLAAFKLAADRCGQCTVALMGIGTSLTRKGDNKGAHQVFLSILGREKDNMEAHYRLALAAINGSQSYAEAKRHLELIVLADDAKYLDLQRRAHGLLRRIDAKVNGYQSAL